MAWPINPCWALKGCAPSPSLPCFLPSNGVACEFFFLDSFHHTCTVLPAMDTEMKATFECARPGLLVLVEHPLIL